MVEGSERTQIMDEISQGNIITKHDYRKGQNEIDYPKEKERVITS